MRQHCSTRRSPASGSTPDEGLQLLESHDLAALGRAADAVTRRLHPEPYPHLQHRPQHQLHEHLHERLPLLRVLAQAGRRGRLRPRAATSCYRKIEETIALGGDQILLQGGMHPELKLEWYEELLRDIKQRFPQVNIHGFSPPEIDHIATVSGLPIERGAACG